jgi:hypothetical protein
MSEAPRRRGISWTAFAAGAVAMLALVLAWSALRKQDEAVEVLRDAVGVVESVPDAPSLPQAPRLPDAPIPQPK